MGDEVVAQVGGVHAVVLGDEAHDHQEVGGRLLNGDAHLLHDLRKRGQGRLDLVLDLNLSHVGVRAGLEGHRDGHAARRVGRRRHVEVAVKTGEVLLDDLRDGVFDRLGGGARIGGGDAYLRRRDLRGLADRQPEDGESAREHDHDGDHPREDGPLNEKA